MRHHAALPMSHIIYTIAIMGFIFTLHAVLPLYSNSSYLALYLSEQNVGLIYMISAAFSILGFLFTPVLIRKIGNYATALWLILLQAVIIFTMISTNDVRIISFCFALQTAVVSLIGFCLDIFLEVHSQVKNVGFIRGMYLTSINSAYIIGALSGSLIIDGGDNYYAVYVAAIFMLFPLFYLVFKNFPRFKDPHYEHPSFLQTSGHVLRNPNHSRLFFTNTILQTFYAWMTVYMALYLHSEIGIDWGGIGIILTIMLLPFVLIELPLGKLADKKYGEKEIMILGFTVLGVFTMCLSFIHSANIWFWAGVLFLTRCGAAAAEIMIETYFFKTVSAKDPNLLGFFRVSRSISFFIAPLLTGAVYLYSQEQGIQFIALGAMCLLAIIPIAGIKDTR